MAFAVALLALGLPAAAFTLWPLLRSQRPASAAAPPDPREPLLERKRQVLRALRELAFEHESGHVSDDDYDTLKARYEEEAAGLLAALDRLAPRTAVEAKPRDVPRPARGWRHPAALVTSAVALVVFGSLLGAGIVRYTEPEPETGMPAPGSRPLASLDAPASGAPVAAGARSVPPEVLRGMLDAARQSLFAGRYTEAIAAYQAVLKRDPKNVDALTHLGLIVAIGGHADTALETLDRALAIDPNYPPALLYRGQVLYEHKRDTAGAVRSWEKFLALVPAGEDHERVKQMIAEAKRAK
jgi:cytochrome c-type biogenesis protein CcmH/NrfG